MDIAFSNEKLRKLCEMRAEAERRLGADCARKLRTRLSDLDAAATVGALVAGRPHPLKGDRTGQFAVDLAGGMRLVFEPNDDSCPRLDDGAVDWHRVSHIRIVFIGDYHD
jgi:proteic killer suppression protein